MYESLNFEFYPANGDSYNWYHDLVLIKGMIWIMPWNNLYL